MKRYIIAPKRRFRVIVQGPLVAAIQAAGSREPTSLRNVSINGYGAVHADMFTDEDVLRQWFTADHDIHNPGTLLFYQEAAK